MTYFSRAPSKYIVITSVISLLLLAGTIGVSYYAVHAIIHPSDYAMHGKHQSQVAREIRAELLKRQGYHAVSFLSQDGTPLSGILVLREKPTANLLVSHGFKGSKEFSYGLCTMFPDWNIFLYDFRAHGESGGHLTTIGVQEKFDVLAAAHFFKQITANKYGKKLPFIALGLSMGGAATLKASEIDSSLCDVLISDSAYANLSVMVRDVFTRYAGLPYYPFFPIANQIFNYLSNSTFDEMSPVKSVEKIKQPIFFIHSCSDKFIPPVNALQLYANASNKTSKLWIAPACRHGSLHIYHSERYKKRVTSFVYKHLPMLAHEA